MELHGDEFEDSFHSYLVLFCILFSCLCFCPFVFFSSKISGCALFALYALFPNEGAAFFSLQVLCSALNHDLPMCVFWGISVSNWYMWHLFNKLWQQEEKNTNEESYSNVPPSPGVLAVLRTSGSDSLETVSWLCRLLSFVAVTILRIYWERTALMEMSCP